ncbi:IS66 family transposase, partial [Escherichia coli]|uniref:IS66 family transposase n=1 Tax=Escherichia coli TaxID=562 RepID=UPI0020249429
HADDTPVPVLLPGNKKTKTGRVWTYVRDDRNAGSTLAPAVWFAYSPARKGIHPQTHLAGFGGVLQAEAVTDGARAVLYTQPRDHSTKHALSALHWPEKKKKKK